MNRPTAIGAAVVVSLFLMAVIWYQLKERDLSTEKAPEQFALIDRMQRDGVPAIEAVDIQGQPIALRDFAGRIVIVNFWASWCSPCVQEFPSLIKLVESFKGKVVLLAVSSDEDENDMNTFLKAFGFPKQNIYIIRDARRAIAEKFGVAKIPESFLIGKNGKLIRKVVGVDDWISEGAIDFFEGLVRE